MKHSLRRQLGIDSNARLGNDSFFPLMTRLHTTQDYSP